MPDNNSQNQNEPIPQRLTYQPFLLAATVIALLVKVVISVSTKQPVLDWLFVVVTILVVAAFLVYIMDRYLRKGPNKRTDVTISIGGQATNSPLTGIRTGADQVGAEKVNIKAGGVAGSPVTGIDRQRRVKRQQNNPTDETRDVQK